MVDTPDSLRLMVNISSSGSERYAFSASYGVAKSGTDRLTRDFAVEGKEDGLTVVGLWPSQVLTEFIVESIDKGDIELDAEHAETPLYTGRVIAKLAGDDDRARYSGQVFTTAELAVAYDVRDERDMQPIGKRLPTTYRDPDLSGIPVAATQGSSTGNGSIQGSADARDGRGPRSSAARCRSGCRWHTARPSRSRSRCHRGRTRCAAAGCGCRAGTSRSAPTRPHAGCCRGSSTTAACRLVTEMPIGT